MAGTPRERILEKKIVTLEQRLVLVERFVEMRFCESFRDFSNRHMPRTSNEDGTSKKVSLLEEVNDVHVDDIATFKNVDSPERQEDLSLTTYRTRSGRTSKRLTATALGIRSGGSGGGGVEPPKKDASSSLKASTAHGREEVPTTSSKVLRVSVHRLHGDSVTAQEKQNERVAAAEGDVEEMEFVDEGRIKIQHETEDEDDGGGGDDYFEFLSEEPDTLESEGPVGVNDDNDAGDSHEPLDNDDAGDEDWNASGREDDEDYTEKGKKQAVAKKRTSGSSTPKQKRKRKKYDVPGRIGLLPEGYKLQLANPDKTDLKECPICHQHCQPHRFDLHVQSHVKERHIKCTFCDKSFFKKAVFLQHIRIHQMDKYGKKCRLCGKISADNYKILAHERVCVRKHLEDDKYVDPKIIQDVRERSKNVDLKWPNPNETIPEGTKKCIHCKRLIETDLLKNHLKQFHAQWKCTFCDETFVFKSGLVRHLCRTHGNNCVTCELCNKTFESKEAVRNHNAKCKAENRKKRGVQTLEEPATGTSTSTSEQKEQEEETTVNQTE